MNMPKTVTYHAVGAATVCVWMSVFFESVLTGLILCLLWLFCLALLTSELAHIGLLSAGREGPEPLQGLSRAAICVRGVVWYSLSTLVLLLWGSDMLPLRGSGGLIVASMTSFIMPNLGYFLAAKPHRQSVDSNG